MALKPGGLQKLLRRALSTTLERTCDHCSEKPAASASEERMMNLPRHLLLLLPRVYYSKSRGDAAKVRSDSGYRNLGCPKNFTQYIYCT